MTSTTQMFWDNLMRQRARLSDADYWLCISGYDPESIAENVVNAIIRRNTSEDGFTRKILPPVELINTLLDQNVITNKPVAVLRTNRAD